MSKQSQDSIGDPNMTQINPVVLQLRQAVVDPTIRGQLAIALAQQLRLEPSIVEQMLAVAGRPITRPMAFADGETVAAIFSRAGLSVELKQYAEPVPFPPPPLTLAPEPTPIEAAVHIEQVVSEPVAVLDVLKTNQEVRTAAMWLGYLGLAACVVIIYLLNTRTTFHLGWALFPVNGFIGIASFVALFNSIRSGQQPLSVAGRIGILLWSWITTSAAAILTVFTYLLPIWLVPFLQSHNFPELSGWSYLIVWGQLVGLSLGILTQAATSLGFVSSTNSAEAPSLTIRPETQLRPVATQTPQEVAPQQNLTASPATEMDQPKPQKATRRLGFTDFIHIGCKWLIGIWTVLCGASVGLGSLSAFNSQDKGAEAWTVLGVTAGLIVVFFFWLVPVAMLAVIAFLTRSKVVAESKSLNLTSEYRH
jgi:hypothetical protein